MNLFETIKKNLKESEEDFKQHVLNDFKLFLDDNGITEPTNQDVNDYFSGMFYDLETEDDLDDMNKAEEIIRTEYKVDPTDESVFEPTEEDIEEMQYWYADDPREDWDAGRTNDYYSVAGFDKARELERLHANESEKLKEAEDKVTSDSFLEQTIDVYDIADLIENLDIKGAEKGEYTAHLGEQRALIPTKDGKYILADYEAVRDIADTEDDTVAISVSKKPAPDSKSFPIFPAGTINVSIKDIKENAPVKQMKAKDFFTKHNYNDRCASNFSGMIGNINGIYHK